MPCICDDTVVWGELVHVPMSLRARTAAQGRSLSAYVPMSLRARTAAQGRSLSAYVPISPLGEDRYAGEWSRKIRNSPKESGRFRGFQRFLERCYQKVPEEWVSGI